MNPLAPGPMPGEPVYEWHTQEFSCGTSFTDAEAEEAARRRREKTEQERLRAQRMREAWSRVANLERERDEALDGLPPVDRPSPMKNETAGLSETELLAKLGIEQPSAEGWFFPDTYHFGEGTSDLMILRRAHRLMLRHLDQEWGRRAPDLPLKSPLEALILASIVEKETGRADERTRVAGVFINRLMKRMKLQSDPTIVYGLVGGKGTLGRSILKSEIERPTPFNTYVVEGLPPVELAAAWPVSGAGYALYRLGGACVALDAPRGLGRIVLAGSTDPRLLLACLLRIAR